MLMVDSDALGLSYFYQDHLRIDQVPPSLWRWHENKINSHLFLYFFCLISVTLRGDSTKTPGSVHPAGPGPPRFPPGSDSLLIPIFLSFISILFPSPAAMESVNLPRLYFVMLSTGTVPPASVPLPDGCLSVSLSGEAAAASVNKRLISPRLVPVCLSVCLTCRQLSRRSGVAVSQVLLSLLLSVHLPVRDSQIRRVNLPPGSPGSPEEL